MGCDCKKERLRGAKFAIFNSCGDKVCEGCTDENGELCFGNLPLGEYTVREICPPPGFCPCKEVFCVRITCEDKDKCLTIVNKAVRGSIKITKFGEF